MKNSERLEFAKKLVTAYRTGKLKASRLTGEIKELNNSLEDEINKEDGEMPVCRDLSHDIADKKIEKRKINGAKNESLEKLFEVIMGEGEYDQDLLGLFDVIGEPDEDE